MSHRRTVLATAVVSLACAGPAAAQAPPGSPPAPLPATTVTVTGTGSVVPKPANPKSSASIAKAVAVAKAAAAPLAIANGRARATKVAALNNLALGQLLAITEGASNPTPFFFVGPYGAQDGTFGPGKYCGTTRQPVIKKGKRVGFRTHHLCRVPPTVSLSYGMTFSTTPA